MSSEKEILSLEDKRYAAMTKGDFGALEALLHDQLLYTHSSGVTDTKASWLDSLKSGKLKFLNAWVKTPNGWKFVAWQSTPQPTP